MIVHVPRDVKINVGRIGTLSFARGLYAYVGSALGPGGLKARILRHLSNNKKKFWHIDYLLEQSHVVAVIIIEKSKKLECVIAREFLGRGVDMVKGFGCSDCRCPSHLFRIEHVNDVIKVVKTLGLPFSILWVR